MMPGQIWTCAKCKKVNAALGEIAIAGLMAGKLKCSACGTVARLEEPGATKEATRGDAFNR